MISAPYRIFIQSIKKTSTPELPPDHTRTKLLRPIEIAKIIVPLYPKDSLEEIKHAGRNRVTIITNNRKITNEILKLDVFPKMGLEAFIPSSYIYKQCIIKNIS